MSAGRMKMHDVVSLPVQVRPQAEAGNRVDGISDWQRVAGNSDGTAREFTLRIAEQINLMTLSP
jgi:hypothetical protein